MPWWKVTTHMGDSTTLEAETKEEAEAVIEGILQDVEADDFVEEVEEIKGYEEARDRRRH